VEGGVNKTQYVAGIQPTRLPATLTKTNPFVKILQFYSLEVHQTKTPQRVCCIDMYILFTVDKGAAPSLMY
jgi:hypothetical protein